MTELEVARELSIKGDFERAYVIADKNLKQDPNSYEWVMVMAHIMLQTEKPTLAYQLAKRATQLKPKEPGGWLNLAVAARDIRKDDESVRFNLRGLKYAVEDRVKANLHVNLASTYVDIGEWDKAEKSCQEAIKLNPDTIKGRANLGFCQLARRDWANGWKNYRYVLGHEWRPEVKYNDSEVWDGESKGTIVLHGEQGLGDQISFASMVPDAIQWAEANDSKIILDVSNRLNSLFRRSFPCSVYGGQLWSKADREVHYSLPIGQIGEYFRTKDSDFSGHPYLTPCPNRVYMWQKLFEAKKKPVIGLAWSGGTEKTGSKVRHLGLEAFRPLVEGIDAHFVSLQYRPAQKEIDETGLDVTEYYSTLSDDYDDTVAMVGAMDMVIGVHTTVIHVAGGLGVPCWTFVPDHSQWRYGEYDDFLWANSVRLIQQRGRDWSTVIKETAKELHARYTGISEGTGASTQKRKLRGNGKEVRGNSQSNH